MPTPIRAQSLQLDQITDRLERTIFMRLKLLGFINTEFDLQNNLSGHRFQLNNFGFFFLKTPFRHSHVYAGVVGRHRFFLPLFANHYYGTPQYYEEMDNLEKIELPKSRLNNYNKRLDIAFDELKEIGQWPKE